MNESIRYKESGGIRVVMYIVSYMNTRVVGKIQIQQNPVNTKTATCTKLASMASGKGNTSALRHENHQQFFPIKIDGTNKVIPLPTNVCYRLFIMSLFSVIMPQHCGS